MCEELKGLFVAEMLRKVQSAAEIANNTQYNDALVRSTLPDSIISEKVGFCHISTFSSSLCSSSNVFAAVAISISSNILTWKIWRNIELFCLNCFCFMLPKPD